MEKFPDFSRAIDFQEIGNTGVIAANISSLTDELPWRIITAGYYPPREGFPSGVLVWGGKFKPDKNGSFRMIERSAKRGRDIDLELVDKFTDFLGDLYADLQLKSKVENT